MSLLRIFAKSSCQFSTSQVLREACSDVSVSPPFGPENFGASTKSNSFPQSIPHTKHPKKKHTHLRGVRNEVKLAGPSAQAPLRTDPFQTSVSRSATTCGSFCRNHKYLPATPSVLFFEATLPLKPATIALEIGHLAFQVDPSRVSNFSPQVCFWVVKGPRFQTLGGFRYMKLGLVVSSHSCMEKMEKSHSRFESSPNFRG